jgi:hypothetical protein
VTAAGVPGTGAQPGVDGFSDLGWGVSGYSYAPTGACPWPGTCEPWNGAVGVRGESLATSEGSGVLGVVQSTADVNSAGVRGIAAGGPGTGVWGVSGSGVAVRGVSVTGNGIVGYNSVTDMSAAAISAIPGSTSALAYWGGGGIMIASSFAQKTGGGSWSAPSDRRIKKDVKDLDRGLAELMRVRPVRYKYNGLGGTEDDGKEYVGVIAQELGQIVPSMVSTRKGKLRKDDAKETEIEIVDPSAFTYMLINSVKQQQKTIEKQEARIAELERRSSPLASSVMPSSLVGWLVLALLPIGMVLGRRRQNRSE